MRREAWGILWRSENALDGRSEYLIGRGCYKMVRPEDVPLPPAGDAQTTLTFSTKGAASDFIRNNFAYIAKRKDLRSEPHGWRMPVPVRVVISVERVS